MSRKEENPFELNRAIHERVRLGIMSALSANGTMSFTGLKELLKTTDGNLSVHARILEENGFLKSEKKFVGRKPLTVYAITAAGRREFLDYMARLKEIIKRSK